MSFVSKQLFVFLAVTSLLLVMPLGLLSSTMSMSAGNRGGCPFMQSGKSEVCNMSPLEHIAQWQNLFAATAPQNSVATVLVLLSFVLSLSLCFSFERKTARIPLKVRIRKRDSKPLFNNALQQFLLRGLLHPKIF